MLDKAETEEVKPSHKPKDGEENPDAIPEVEINNLDTILISGTEYVFLKDLEKVLDLRLDEFLAMICTKFEFPLDNSNDYLVDMLLPLADSVEDIVVLVNENVEQSDHSHVSNEEFMEVHAIL